VTGYAGGVPREAYPSDVSEEEWALVVPYLTLMTEEAPQREYSLRTVFNALRWMGRTGAAWRRLPQDFPPWAAVYQQAQRWLKAGVFEALVEDLRVVLRVAQGREGQPSAALLDSRPLPSSPESGHRAGDEGAKRKRGSKVHIAVDTLGQWLALRVTAADEQDRAQVKALVAQVQEVTGETVEIAFVDQAYTGEQAAHDAAQQGITLAVVKLPRAKKGFVLLPRRRVVERSFAWAARFRRLVRDYERLPETVAGLHFRAFAILMLKRVVMLMVQSA
jgi:transposase